MSLALKLSYTLAFWFFWSISWMFLFMPIFMLRWGQLMVLSMCWNRILKRELSWPAYHSTYLNLPQLAPGSWIPRSFNLSPRSNTRLFLIPYVITEVRVPLGIRSLKVAARPLYPRLLYTMGTICQISPSAPCFRFDAVTNNQAFIGPVTSKSFNYCNCLENFFTVPLYGWVKAFKAIDFCYHYCIKSIVCFH